MDQKLIDIILEKTNSTRFLDSELIQQLWSGYGELRRVYLDTGSVILKFINTSKNKDHPRGWNSILSHQRKLKSYQVEMAWYKNHNQHSNNFLTPKLIYSETFNDYQILILEDLKNKSFFSRTEISMDQIKLCLNWLASFHAHFLNFSSGGLWPIGTYWHLATRPEELEAIKDQELKEKANIIDQKLNQAKYKTLVHGDAKLANFMFSKSQVAAVDFQYIGGGVGVKDLAYFLSSVFNEEELYEKEDECLHFYFKNLSQHIGHRKTENEWRELYSFAWCDFVRFLLGWSPNHYKLNSYSQKIKKEVLACI